nr:MAG TPA: hypothetical protein [Caudoviricetes sp.]
MPKIRQKVEKFFCEFTNNYMVVSAFSASLCYLYLAPLFKYLKFDILSNIIP